RAQVSPAVAPSLNDNTPAPSESTGPGEAGASTMPNAAPTAAGSNARDPSTQAAGTLRSPAEPTPTPGRALAPEDALTLDPPSSTCTPEQAEASFGADDRLVMAYYYYWYDQSSLDDPALALHPPADLAPDWHDVAWHERQLTDMASAGVDVA